MPLLLLPPRYSPDSIALRGAALEAGWEVERLASWRVPEHVGGRTDLVFYGEPLFAAVVSSQLGVRLLEPTLDWPARLPERLLGRRVRFARLGEARAGWEGGPRFVKPADDKAFASRVYASAAELPGPDALPDGLPVLLADPVDWALEVRAFVRERRVLTCSAYLRDGELAQARDGSWPLAPEEAAAARAFLDEVLAADDVSLPPGVALDVGLLRQPARWAVVEANAAWGAGIYGCDPAAVLPAVARACVAPAALSPDDARWVVARGER